MERKLAAILCADVYGYSRLMGEDEEATLHTLTSHRKLIDSQIENHHGRFVNSAGDSVLAEFARVVEAVNCAVEIQTGLQAENASLVPERRMEFRIGVNLGDVMVEGDQIHGDGVNVAARLESLAEPGGISISGIVHDQCATGSRSATKIVASRPDGRKGVMTESERDNLLFAPSDLLFGLRCARVPAGGSLGVHSSVGPWRQLVRC